MKIINWNISYIGDIKLKIEFINSFLSDSFCAILQEVKPNSYNAIKEILHNKANFIYSLDYRQPSKFDSQARKLGVLILTSKNIKIIDAGVVTRNIFPDRTVFATLQYNSKIYKVLGVHSITGCSYHKAKSIQYDCLAEFIDSYKPDIIGIDANEPEIDSVEISKMQFFNNGNGARSFFNTIQSINLADSYVNFHNLQDNNCIPKSHFIKQKGAVRYDFIFLNNNYKIQECLYLYDEAINAGSDHALIYSKIEC